MLDQKIALLTYRDHPTLPDGERLLPPAFAAVGIEAIAVPWDVETDWDQYSAIILRACWNYHKDRDRFLKWLDTRVSEGLVIWNPPEVLKWNTDKQYLFDLQKKGIQIVPSVIVDKLDPSSIKNLLEKNTWREAILKPTIGASAYGIQKFDIHDIEVVTSSLDHKQTWILQEFRPEINTTGEYSLVFFNGKYSHSAIKIPKLGDFRSQPEFGGKEATIEPDSSIIDQAQGILNTIPGPLLYARVDGLLIHGIFHLMELELAEPYLFFENHPVAPRKFVEEYLWLSEQPKI